MCMCFMQYEGSSSLMLCEACAQQCTRPQMVVPVPSCTNSPLPHYTGMSSLYGLHGVECHAGRYTGVATIAFH